MKNSMIIFLAATLFANCSPHTSKSRPSAKNNPVFTFTDSLNAFYAYIDSFYIENAKYDPQKGYYAAETYLDSLHVGDATHINWLSVRLDSQDGSATKYLVRDDIEGSIGSHVISEKIMFYVKKDTTVSFSSSSYTSYERYDTEPSANRLLQARRVEREDVGKVIKRVLR